MRTSAKRESEPHRRSARRQPRWLMEDHDNKQKSPHLQQLEEAFEKRTRRFSAFEILGLTPDGDQKLPEDQRLPTGPSKPISVSDDPAHGPDEHTQGSTSDPNSPKRAIGVSDSPSHGSVKHTPGTAVSKTLSHGPETPTPDPVTPIPGAGDPALARHTTARDSASHPIDAPEDATPGSYRHTHGGISPIPGEGFDDKQVVVVNKTTTAEKPIPGTGLEDTATGGDSRHSEGSYRYR